MGKFDERTLALARRLQKARLSMMLTQPFYALLLMHMTFALDITCPTAYTDGDRIAFHPDFLESLSDKELDFVLMHEVLHAALSHPLRTQSDYDIGCFDVACDIVVNSNIYYSAGYDEQAITLSQYGVSMHRTPDGKDGYLFSAEQIYGMVLAQKQQLTQRGGRKGQPGGSGGDGQDPGQPQDDGSGENPGETRGDGSGEDPQGGQEGNSQGPEDPMQDLINKLLQKGKYAKPKAQTPKPKPKKKGSFDDHSFWEGDDPVNSQKGVWLQRMVDATDLLAGMEADGITGCGNIPLAAQRLIDQLKNPVLDWRQILQDFIQEEICDYSFSPPDKRMEDSPFFLPDFNETDESAKDILFMIDTSASMSKHDITQCYGEILSGIGQFGGKLQGWLGFFDAEVVEPVPFCDEEDFKIIRPSGGGGTSFDIIFDYVRDKMGNSPPASIVILTDGGAPFPQEEAAQGIPVLWVINNLEAEPPWGKVARLVEKPEVEPF